MRAIFAALAKDLGGNYTGHAGSRPDPRDSARAIATQFGVVRPLRWLSAGLWLGCGLLTQPAGAHELGWGYLTLEVERAQIRGQLEISVTDAAAVLGVAGGASREAVHARQAELARRVAAAIEIVADDTACPVRAADVVLERITGIDFVRLELSASCAAPVQRLSVRYSLRFAQDPAHRCLLAIRSWAGTQASLFTRDRQQMDFVLRPNTPWHHFRAFLQEGMQHIASGYDHLCFLLALLLPAALVWQRRRWRPRDDPRQVVLEIVAVVTSFTLAHSITLALAAFEWVALPVRWVEVLIALSILVAAFNNLQPFVRARPWVLGLVFGLVHGFGFASALRILALPAEARVIALAAFNLGVELAQLALVALLLPLLLVLRHRAHYARLCVDVPSALIAWLAGVWLLERALGIRLIS